MMLQTPIMRFGAGAIPWGAIFDLYMGSLQGRWSFKILTGKLTGKRPLGSSKRRWEDSIRIDFKEIVVNTLPC